METGIPGLELSASFTLTISASMVYAFHRCARVFYFCLSSWYLLVHHAKELGVIFHGILFRTTLSTLRLLWSAHNLLEVDFFFVPFTYSFHLTSFIVYKHRKQEGNCFFKIFFNPSFIDSFLLFLFPYIFLDSSILPSRNFFWRKNIIHGFLVRNFFGRWCADWAVLIVNVLNKSKMYHIGEWKVEIYEHISVSNCKIRE